MAFLFRKNHIQAASCKQGGDGRTGRPAADDEYIADFASYIASYIASYGGHRRHCLW
jgi:hypothetical protein